MNTARLGKKTGFGLFRVSDFGVVATPWYHTIPLPGEYPGMSVYLPGQGEPVADQTIVITAEDYPVILAAFQRDRYKENWNGLLVDKEHFSLDPSESSEAAAWVEDMRIEIDGIWTRWKLTSIGEELLNGDVYRMRSPVSDLEKVPGREGCWRMIRLTGIGLTNTPFFKNLSSEARARGENTKGADMLLEQLRARLKLDAAANEQAVLAKVNALLDKGNADGQALATASARVTTLESAEKAREWDAFLAANKERIADVESMKASFTKDPEAVKGLFKALKPAVAPQAAGRRIGQDAETPTAAASQADVKLDRGAVRKLASEIVRDERCTHAQALCRAERRLRVKNGEGK